MLVPESVLLYNVRIPFIKTRTNFIVWRSFFYPYIHLSALYGLYLLVTEWAFLSFFFGIFVSFSAAAYGIAGGAHRLWTHKAFKANWKLKLIFMFFQTLAGQNTIDNWAKDHRVHHKFSDQDPDPHNVKRGFFFAHIGWLFIQKPPEYFQKAALMDFSDLDNDWVVQFQKKHYVELFFVIGIFLPTYIPMLLWGESLNVAFHVSLMLGYVIEQHIIWSLNSVAHTHGYRPYDRNLRPTQFTLLGTFGVGEAWHNFHHTFPWDYRNSEVGTLELGYVNRFIEFFASIGWAWDLKTVSPEIVQRRVLRTGDGSHKYSSLNNNNEQIDSPKEDKNLWGWEDTDMDEFDKKATTIFKKCC